MRRILAASVLSLSLLAMPAFAALEEPVPVLAADFSPEGFQQQRQSILDDLAAGERYAEIKAENRDTVLSLLDEMGQIIAAAPSVDALNDAQRIRLFNHQEQVNALLLQAADDSRLLCNQRVRTGSHRRTVDCETVAQRRERRERDQNTLRLIQRPTTLPSENSVNLL